MMRHTKIICTLGPATQSPERIRALLEAGMDVARLNAAHGTHEDQARLIAHVRQAGRELSRTVPILYDLQGPKIRIGSVEGDAVELRAGQQVLISTEPLPSTSWRLSTNYAHLPEDVRPGDRILLDDGLMELRVLETRPREVLAVVEVGGLLRSRKGMNLPRVPVRLPALTSKDREDLRFALAQGVEWIALSFVRTAEDVRTLRREIAALGGRAGVVAKIEKPEAVEALEEILEVADAVMVARGDLGIEASPDQIPLLQKDIIRKSLQRARPIITATQMLESMVENPRPTRAEATDVANAVLDGTDAVMLSAETAMGRHPVEAVRVMARIIEATEARPDLFPPHPFTPARTAEEAVTEAISYTACELARQVGARAIACLTFSGQTARVIAKYRPWVPIVAFTDDPHVAALLHLVRGTIGVPIPFQAHTDAVIDRVREELLRRGWAKPGDRVVITAGMPLPAKGRTNMVQVATL
ncbi:MAG: pyruvate kinase [Bacteroidetes bacterium]|nr:pyruvate kinase [Bacteroidota bacterium]